MFIFCYLADIYKQLYRKYNNYDKKVDFLFFYNFTFVKIIFSWQMENKNFTSNCFLFREDKK